MHCCANCFGDSFLGRRIPDISGQSGLCDFCASSNVPLVDPITFLDLFQAVTSIYTESDAEDAKLLVEWFQSDWQIFNSLDLFKAQSLLGEILDDGEIVRRKHIPLNAPSLDVVVKWKSFCDEIMLRNRFFFQHELDLKRLETLFKVHLETDGAEFNRQIYRARIQGDNVVIPLEKMGKPPIALSKNGRANPVGIPYFYAASTPDTAIAETRPHPGDKLTVAKFEITQGLRLLDLRNPRRTISPFNVDEDELTALRYELEFLCHLGGELSKPILPRVADLEYLPTQYLCEFIKNCGYDGVVFNSSISSGSNVTLFGDSKVGGNEVKQHTVTKLLYEHQCI